MLCCPTWKYLVLLSILFELIIISIHIFKNGFLLTRDVLEHKSECQNLSVLSDSLKNCHLSKKFDKIILVVIDALRYDFIAYNSSITKLNEEPYQNKMRFVNNLLVTKPTQSRLYKFMADAPTTTMQRLKGLTTGSLPTFIDLSLNFASTEITEDNIIDQMYKAGLKIIALGDDTWGNLFPNRFHRSFFFPSFNIMDMDTVDNGIMQNLNKEIKTPDWNFIVAHFLGVDHCGHKLGPSHPQMTRKLLQMNKILQNVSALLDTNTLLIVMGDHGMTAMGDHGGDSVPEMESALFFYSPGLDLPPSMGGSSQVVAQVDIVPTISSLLGIPIPFSNLGKTIEDIVSTKVWTNSHALALNYAQMKLYLEKYQTYNNDFPPNIWLELKNILNTIDQTEDNKAKEHLMEKFIIMARIMCEEIWAKFNVVRIVLGLISFSAILLTVFNLLPQKEFGCLKSALHNFKYFIFLFFVVNLLYIASLYLNSILLVVATCVSLLLAIPYRRLCLPAAWDIVPVVAVLILGAMSFSNSFVVNEDAASAFILVSLVAVVFIRLLKKRIQSVSNTKTHLRLKNFLATCGMYDFVLLCIVVILFLCVRSGYLFLRCREEQPTCAEDKSFTHVPLIALPREMHNARFLTSLGGLFVVIWGPRRLLQRCGNLNGGEATVTFLKVLSPLCGLITAAFWALQSVPSAPHNISRVAVHLPQLIFLLLSLGVFAVTFYPLLLYVVPRPSQDMMAGGDGVIPQLFLRLKKTYEGAELKYSPPIVYGLATGVSAPLVMIVSLCALGIVLVAEDGFAPAVALLGVTACLIAVLHAYVAWMQADSIQSLMHPSWVSVALWFLLGVRSFYATGHQTVFSTLAWRAAFVGNGGAGGAVFTPAAFALILINTFSAQLLLGLALPLLVTVPLSAAFLWPSIKGNNKIIPNETGCRGEFLLIENPHRAKEGFVSTALLYIFFHSLKVFLSCCSCFWLRRHLMVWKVFAPHLVFEAVGLAVTCVAVIAGGAIYCRTLTVVHRWSEKIESLR